MRGGGEKGKGKKKALACRNPGLNQGPLDLQSNALPTELFRLINSRCWFGVFILKTLFGVIMKRVN